MLHNQNFRKEGCNNLIRSIVLNQIFMLSNLESIDFFYYTLYYFKQIFFW